MRFIRTFVHFVSSMLTLQQISEPVLRELSIYRDKFEAALLHDDDLLGSVLEHVRRRKGKMMRPLLVLLSARAFGEVNEAAYRSAVTLELLHTASLLHDDVVDESDERRGQRSVNAVYDNKIAVLVGDYLLSSSLEQATLTNNMRIVNRIAVLGKMLSDGEVKQLASTRKGLNSEQTYYEIIQHKTAELFAACAELGAISTNAPESEVQKSLRLGKMIGMCFQIRDDIFDYYEDEKIGKPTGNDMREGKLTLPVIYALSNNPDKAMLAIAAKVKEGSVAHSEIVELVDFTKRNGGIDYAVEVMGRMRKEARLLIPDSAADEIRVSLEAYIDFVAARNI